MKHIFVTVFILSGLLVFFTSANPGVIYNCIDRDGNKVITDIPREGMEKCEPAASYETPPREPVEKKEKTVEEKKDEGKKDEIAKKEEKLEASKERIDKCINCCENKASVCYNYTADSMRCNGEKQNCIATCNSEGSSPSSWSDCWSASGGN
ncbi:MAG: DUF4124 domain-containing protein [Syntrophaceae bacterium]|nr:DUF4124 domain-containing protein [Syntrophaceae bacterium]